MRLTGVLLSAIQKLFETEEGQREFEEWRAEKQKLQLNNKSNIISKTVETNGNPQ